MVVKKFKNNAKLPKSNDKKPRWEVSIKSTDETQAEESDPGDQGAEMVVRNVLMIASVKRTDRRNIEQPKVSKSMT